MKTILIILGVVFLCFLVVLISMILINRKMKNTKIESNNVPNLALSIILSKKNNSKNYESSNTHFKTDSGKCKLCR